MAGHTLPEGSELIQGLARLGEALGYHVKTELPVSDRQSNPPAVDVAWFNEDGQDYPLMIFEVESRATNSAVNNPVKVFSQNNEAFEKPLFFFHVFLKAGANSSRLENLRTLFGAHNYRIYTLSSGATQSLLEDVLSQHRRLFQTISLRDFCEELTSETWAGADLGRLLRHIESLTFCAQYLAFYCSRGVLDQVYRAHYFRYLNENKAIQSNWLINQEYGTYMGDCWGKPLHIAILANQEPFSDDWLKELREWQENLDYMTQIGPHFGLDRDYDLFILEVAPGLLVLIALLMQKVQGASLYICQQLMCIFRAIQKKNTYAAQYAAAWALYLAGIANSTELFDEVRKLINNNGGVSHNLLCSPPGCISLEFPDDYWISLLALPSAPVPPLAEFRKLVALNSAEVDIVRIGLRALSEEDLTWSSELAIAARESLHLSSSSANAG